MTRLKAQPDEPITDLEGAEAAMTRLCRVQADIKIKQAQLTKRVVKINSEGEDRIKPLMAEEAELVQRLTHFAEEHKDLIPKNAKSIKLTNGKVGTRHQSGKLGPVAKDKKSAAKVEERAIETLETEAPHCVQTKKSIKLKALRDEGPEMWKKVGFGLIGARDVPFAEPSANVVQNLVDQLSAEG